MSSIIIGCKTWVKLILTSPKSLVISGHSIKQRCCFARVSQRTRMINVKTNNMWMLLGKEGPRPITHSRFIQTSQHEGWPHQTDVDIRTWIMCTVIWPAMRLTEWNTAGGWYLPVPWSAAAAHTVRATGYSWKEVSTARLLCHIQCIILVWRWKGRARGWERYRDR